MKSAWNRLRFRVLLFKNSKFVMKVFAPDRPEKILAGDDRAHFEMLLNGGTSGRGVQSSGFRVHWLTVRNNIENIG
ncbi:MAG: hypothetical protein ABIL06_12860 [Pseudomonadota bacterium]